jgi:chromosome segregation ATPase
MSNVIQLNVEENSVAVKQAIDVLTGEIDQYSSTVETAKQKLQEHTNRIIEIDVALAGCTDNAEAKRLKEELKKVRAQAKQQENIVKVTADSLTTAQVDLGKLKNATNNEWKSKTSENLVTRTFEQNNLHYVINGQNWWMVDPDGNRKSPKIISLTSGMVKDTIFLDTDWIVKDDQELKSFAKDPKCINFVVDDYSEQDEPI